MIRGLSLAVLVALAGCSEKSGAPAAPPPVAPAPVEPEPERITVQHVLVAWYGATGAGSVKRSEDEAKALALEILERAKKGEDFDALVRRYSTDPGGGTYTLVNHGVRLKDRNETPRAKFIKPFVDVAFKLKVGDVGLVDYSKDLAPYGWHVIKRIK